MALFLEEQLLSIPWTAVPDKRMDIAESLVADHGSRLNRMNALSIHTETPRSS